VKNGIVERKCASLERLRKTIDEQAPLCVAGPFCARDSHCRDDLAYSLRHEEVCTKLCVQPLRPEEGSPAVTICHNYYPIMSHNGKVYVVTGANSGIGLAAAKLLIEEGAKVYITGRNAEAVADAAKQLGPNAIGIRADAATVADSVAMAKFIEQQGDKLDG
jgi:hypothetical protein